MVSKIIRYVMVLPLALLSLFIYKLALQPAIHEFYSPQPNMLMVYGLVIVAALVHAVLLSGVVLKFYQLSLRVISSVMSLAVLVNCIQLSWISPLPHTVFWLVVFISYITVWIVILWAGQWLTRYEQDNEVGASHNGDAITDHFYSVHGRKKHS